MSRAAKATLIASIVISSLIVWGVHHLQDQEHDMCTILSRSFYVLYQLVLQTMYQGVLRDDERRRRKMKEREEELLQSQRKREIYERVQRIETIPQPDAQGS
jgi:protein PET117